MDARNWSLRKDEPNLILYEKYLDINPEEEIEEIETTSKSWNRKKLGIIGAAVAIIFLITIPAAIFNQNIRKQVKDQIQTVQKEFETIKGAAIANSKIQEPVVMYNKEELMGQDGKEGEAGLSGADGINGTDGINGSAGVNGKDGMNGQNGSAGRDGVKGTDGANGINGKDGIKGTDGANGKSTYDLAMEAGYTGTEGELATTLSKAEQRFLMIDSNMVGMKTEIDQNIDTLNSDLTNTRTELQQSIEQCFQSVSDGKKLLASALLTKGVQAQSDATFEQYKNDILSISQTITVNNMPGTIEYVYHNHSGSAAINGGCYTKAVYHTHNANTCYCQGTKKYSGFRTPKGEDGKWGYRYICNVCGVEEEYRSNSPEWDHVNSGGWKCNILKCSKDGNLESYALTCGYVEGQIVEAKIKFN